MWFYEHRRFGVWHPVTVADRPVTETVDGTTRIRGAGGLGPAIRSLTAVPVYLQHLTLDQLTQVFGADGRFAAAHRRESQP